MGVGGRCWLLRVGSTYRNRAALNFDSGGSGYMVLVDGKVGDDDRRLSQLCRHRE